MLQKGRDKGKKEWMEGERKGRREEERREQKLTLRSWFQSEES